MPTQTGTDGNETLTGTAEVDELIGLGGDDLLQGLSGDDILNGGTGRNRLEGGDGSDTASYLTATSGVTVSLAITAYQQTGHSEDQLVGIESLIGSALADVLTGNDAGNVLDTGSRYAERPIQTYFFQNNGDRVSGGGGADFINVEGNSNGDILNGDSGDDSITVGFSGSRQFIGATVFTAFDGAPVQINGGDGADRLSAVSHAIINGGDGDDVITTGYGRITQGSRVAYFIPEGTDRTVRLTGGAGADTFVISNPVGTAVITDFQVGLDRLDLSRSPIQTSIISRGTVLIAQDGADTIFVDSQNFDIVYARLLNTDARTIPATTYLNNEPTSQGPYYVDPTLVYTYGSTAADIIRVIGSGSALGRAGADQLYGDEGANRLDGGEGDDYLAGGAGNDILIGGLGNDVLQGGAGDDSLDGGEGANAVDYEGAAAAVTVNLATRQATGGEGTDTLSRVSSIYGSRFDDVLTGDDGANVFLGRGGSDRIVGGGGADLFRYRADDGAGGAIDVLADFQTGQDRLDLSLMNPTATAIVRTDTGSLVFLNGTIGGPRGTPPRGYSLTIDVAGVIQGSDILFSGGTVFMMLDLVGRDTAADALVGSSLNDRLFGLGGDDRLTGGFGADLLTGGAGADTFVYRTQTDSTAASLDIILDFQTGVDRIDLTAVAPTQVVLQRYNGATYVYAPTGFGVQLSLAANGVIQGHDVLTGGSATGVTLIGDVGADELLGTDQSDVLTGGSGNDLLVGGGARDTLTGGAGADTFRVPTFSESQGAGFDIITDFETGVDRIELGPIVRSVSIVRDGGASYVFAQTALSPNTSSFTTTIAASGRDINAADLGSLDIGVFLSGSAGADTLIGAARGDALSAGAGNDVLIGAGGADALFGGAGADVFRYRAASESASAAADIIQDFTTGSDRIDLTAVRTGQADRFGIAYSTGGSFVFVDLGGDGTTDMLIQAIGTVAATDILWAPPSTAPATSFEKIESHGSIAPWAVLPGSHAVGSGEALAFDQAGLSDWLI